MSAATHLSLVRLDAEATQLSDLLARTDQCTDRAGYVPRDPALVPSGLFATVREEGVSLASFHGTDWAAIVEELALQDILGLAPHALSGGQTVRAAIAITAAAGPGVWLLDRCFEWLDAKSRVPVRAFFARQLEAGCLVTEVANRDNWLLGPRAQRCMPSSAHRHAEPPASGDPVLIVEGLCIELPGISIGPIDLVVRRGERLALLGPNGAGKTSVARAILGLTDYRGRVRFPGQAGKRAAAVLAFQNPDHQLFRPTVRREMEEAAQRLHAFDVERAKMMVKCLGLDRVLDQDPLALPFAMRRLVTIAAALIPHLPVAILDEPSAFLDEEQVASVLRAAHDAARRGTAVIAISHDAIFVDAFASRAIHLERGQLITPPVSG